MPSLITLISLVLSLGLLSLTTSASAAPTAFLTAPTCFRMASQPISGLLPKTLAPTPVPVCTEFFNYQTAIRLPNDTASVKYGTLDPRGPRFYDRRGKPFNIRAGLVPSTFTPEQEWPLYQTVFKAFLGKFGTVYKLEAALFVENAAMLRPFRGASFAGLAKVLGPPPGVPDSDWLFLTFENTVRNTSRGLNQNVGELWGTFVNRAKAVKFQNVCHRAFVSNATEQAYYSKYLGTTNKVTLAWFPGMVGFSTQSRSVDSFSVCRVPVDANSPSPCPAHTLRLGARHYLFRSRRRLHDPRSSLVRLVKGHCQAVQGDPQLYFWSPWESRRRYLFDGREVL